VRKATGVTRAGIKKWRDGDFKRLTAQHLFAIADLFGCDPRWLASGHGVPFPSLDIRLLEIQAAWKKSNESGREYLVEQARYVTSIDRFVERDAPTQGAALRA
jgi:transcriptional regulator with XRE-family HTH domain